MRKLIFALVLGVIFSCCKEDIALFEGNSSIYFDNDYDTLYVSWGMVPTGIKTQEVQLRVNLFGEVKTYPRKFNILVQAEETDTLHAQAGVDYLSFPLEYEMPPLTDHIFIDIELLRTDTLMKQARRFTVRLLENEEFGFEYMKYRRRKSDDALIPVNDHWAIQMNEEFPRPWWWYRIGEPIFGGWSAKKGILICDIGNIDRPLFFDDLTGVDGRLTEARLKFVGRKLHLWLQENPTPDEDGNPMEMGEESIY